MMLPTSFRHAFLNSFKIGYSWIAFEVLGTFEYLIASEVLGAFKALVTLLKF